MASLIDYPTGLPAPLLRAYKPKELEAWRSNDTQIGPPRYEKLTDNPPVFFNAAFSFSEMEYQLFEGWFKYETDLGSKSFNINLKVGAGYQPHECYFNSSYDSSLNGKRWQVSCKLVAIEKVRDNQDIYDDLKLLFENIEPPVGAWIDKFNYIMEVVAPNNLGA